MPYVSSGNVELMTQLALGMVGHLTQLYPNHHIYPAVSDGGAEVSVYD